MLSDVISVSIRDDHPSVEVECDFHLSAARGLLPPGERVVYLSLPCTDQYAVGCDCRRRPNCHSPLSHKLVSAVYSNGLGALKLIYIHIN